MGNTTTSWADFLQNAAGSVLGTGLDVYKAKNTQMASFDPSTGLPYVDGQSYRPQGNQVAGGGMSSTVMLLIGAAVVALLVLK